MGWYFFRDISEVEWEVFMCWVEVDFVNWVVLEEVEKLWLVVVFYEMFDFFVGKLVVWDLLEEWIGVVEKIGEVKVIGLLILKLYLCYVVVVVLLLLGGYWGYWYFGFIDYLLVFVEV